VSEVPEVAIRLADSLQLPLVEVPWKTRFSEITEAVLEHVLDRQHALLRQSEQIHELLTEVVLSGGQLNQIRDSVTKLLSRRVSIVDRWGDPADGSSAAQKGDADLPRQATALPIMANEQPLGTMYITATDQPLSDLDLRIARHGATAAALIMLMQKAFAEGEARSRTEFVSSLLHGWIDEPGAIESRAAALGIDPRRRYVVVYLRLDAPIADAAALDAGRWALSRALAARRMPALEAWQGNEAALLLPAGSGRPSELIRHLIQDAATLVRRHQPKAQITTGIGSPVDALVEAPRSFREAMTACRLGYIVNGRGTTTGYWDLEAYPALFEATTSSQSGAAFEELRDRYLAPIIQYEERARLPLTETLTALFDSNGNVSAAARALGINRQSLLYRLAKVEALLGLDLSSPMSRFALELALRARFVESGAGAGPTRPDPHKLT
jgi:purine catabolism regulator